MKGEHCVFSKTFHHFKHPALNDSKHNGATNIHYGIACVVYHLAVINTYPTLIRSYGGLKLEAEVSFMCLGHCVFAQELF